MLRLFILAFRLSFKLVLLAAEAVFWVIWLLVQLLTKGIDGVRGALSLRGGGLHCPRGHEIPTTGGTYECAACGWVQQNTSILRCSNSECGAATPYVNCPTCGLSVRNPWRWGRPSAATGRASSRGRS